MMLDGPEEFSSGVEPLVVAVETGVGSNVYRVDSRLRIDEVRLESDERLSQAAVSVRMDGAADVFESRQPFHPDCRMVVRTNETQETSRSFLIEGYPRVQESSWSGQSGYRQDELTLEIVSVADRLGRDRRCQIYGRQMRSAEIEDGLNTNPSYWGSKSVLVSALLCQFNPNGARNCHPTPLQVTDTGGRSRKIYIFTYDSDWQARRWTYLNALRYLWWFYSLSGGPVSAGNLLEATEPYADVDYKDRFSLSGAGGSLIQQLLQPVDSLWCENQSLLSAMGNIVRSAGVHFAIDAVRNGGGVRSEVRLWAPQDGTRKKLYLVRGGQTSDGLARYSVGNQSASQILKKNNVYRGMVEWNFRNVVNAPIVKGGVKMYEFTLPLVPGWEPEENLDNVPEGEEWSAASLAMTEDQIAGMWEDPNNYAWYRNYHKDGSDFRYHYKVGRKWVLNEAGSYDPAVYNRNAPFDGYQPFDWSSVADDTVAKPGQWSRRERRLVGSIVREALQKGKGVYVEVSFDSGNTWCPELYQSVTGLSYEVGIYFSTRNLTDVTPPRTNPAVSNLWYSMIWRTFRVRVTGLIESDERLIYEWPANGYPSCGLQVNSKVLDKSKEYWFISREGVTNEIEIDEDEIESYLEDGTDAMAGFAARYARTVHDRRVFAMPAIPWLEGDYQVGDRLTEISGRGIDLGTYMGNEKQYPVIRRIVYRMTNGYETELSIERPDATARV